MYGCGSSGRSSSNSHGHAPHDGASSFTILFDLPNKVDDESTVDDPNKYYYSSSSSSCSSPVDCTLSLGTASTRQSTGPKSPKRSSNNTNHWAVLSQPKQSPASSRATSYGDGAGDSLLARRCANCDTTSTPLWRNGPRGPKSLCNACGIRYKKEQRRAAATAPEPSYSAFHATNAAAATDGQSRHGMGYGFSHDHPWAYPAPAPASSTTSKSTQHSISLSSGSGRWAPDSHAAGEETTAAMPYLSWCFNVPPPRAEFLHH